MSDFLTEKNKKTGILGKLKWILYVFFYTFFPGSYWRIGEVYP